MRDKKEGNPRCKENELSGKGAHPGGPGTKETKHSQIESPPGWQSADLGEF